MQQRSGGHVRSSGGAVEPNCVAWGLSYVLPRFSGRHGVLRSARFVRDHIRLPSRNSTNSMAGAGWGLRRVAGQGKALGSVPQQTLKPETRSPPSGSTPLIFIVLPGTSLLTRPPHSRLSAFWLLLSTEVAYLFQAHLPTHDPPKTPQNVPAARHRLAAPRRPGPLAGTGISTRRRQVTSSNCPCKSNWSFGADKQSYCAVLDTSKYTWCALTWRRWVVGALTLLVTSGASCQQMSRAMTRTGPQ
jgi:hypothetical protein